MVLVTGASGFLGTELIHQLLVNGEKIRALKRASSVIPDSLRDEDQIEWVSGDLRDYFSLDDALAGVTKVYHCAAFISFASRDKKQMMKVNVEGTVNLLNACVANNISKFIHVSSVAAVGDSKNGEFISETDHWDFGSGQSAYSISKYLSEMEVFRAGAEGLNTVIVNPSIILGKNAGKEGSGQLFETVNKGLSYFPGGSFGYVAVEDVAKAMISLMESEINNERFIISAENWTYRDFFSEIALHMGKKPPGLELRPWMLNAARFGKSVLALFSKSPNTLTKDTVRSAFKTQQYSNEKIKSALSLQFRSIKDTIADISAQYHI